MSEPYQAILTDIGKKLETQATATGLPVRLTGFVVGDGGGQAVTPDPSRTSLVNECYRGKISDLVVSPDQANQLIARLSLSAAVGGFVMRELGLVTAEGELYSVANCPAIEKPSGGVAIMLNYRLAVNNASSITLSVASGDGLFLRIKQDLADVSDKEKARENLGLKNAAVMNVGKTKNTVAAGDDDRIINAVPNSRTVNKKGLTSDITLSASDVGALPLTGGNMKGEINGAYTGSHAFAEQYKTQAPYYQDYTTTGKSEYWPVIKQRARLSGNAWAFSMGTLVSGTTLTWQLHIIGSAGQTFNHSWDTAGNYSCAKQVKPGDWANFDARYQPKGNYTPAGQAYTKAESNARFLQGVRLGAIATATNGNNDNIFADSPNGAVVVSVQQKSNYTAIKYRYAQYNLNGTWYNAGAA